VLLLGINDTHPFVLSLGVVENITCINKAAGLLIHYRADSLLFL